MLFPKTSLNQKSTVVNSATVIMLTFGCHFYSFYSYLVQFSSLLLLYCSSLFFRLKDIATLDQPQALHCRYLVPGNTQKILTEIWHHFWLKMMVKSGLEKKYFEIQWWPSDVPANPPGKFSLLGRFFALGSSNSEGHRGILE